VSENKSSASPFSGSLWDTTKEWSFLMKVLILSCNTGGGHNAAASALKESLNFYHHEAEVLDLMSLGRKHTSALVGGAYVKLVSVFPAGFGALYQLGELVRKFPWKSPVYYANARLGNALADYIDQNHFNAVVTTHLYPAETLTWLKQKGRLTIPCVAVATDYACIPFWEETNCDYYVVPHKDLIPEFASCGIPEEKLLPLGIPVRPAFARPASKEDVRRHLGLPENAPLFLVMSGSMGFGKVHLLAHELVSRLENGEQAVEIIKSGCVRSGCSSIRTQMYISSVLHATLRNIWPLPMCCLQSPGA
jgi:processive 1,2-diacylglycerol beta-glucosyltransferase